ncbi:DUF58 domain-containing protein [Dermabacteraceae bacterium TAE3-ERU27]|nr:DUF58 domain-containing protein [Dermabacteraceae bacterium TAE3-ERU27]
MATSLLTRVKARLELRTLKKTSGLIQGRGRSQFKGSGEDFDDLRTYQSGDRISDIDWKASARTNEPLVRRFNEERVRHIAIVADTSRAMAATARDGSSKSAAMLTAAGLICYLAQQNGDLVSLVAGSAHNHIQLPARASDGHLELLLRTIQRSTTLQAHASDSAWLLERASKVIARPSLIVYLTDEAHPSTADYQLLRKLTVRHDMLIVRVRDADPLQPDKPNRDVRDVEHPRVIETAVRSRRDIAAQAAQVRDARERQVKEMLTALRIPQIVTDGDSTVVNDMVAALRRRQGSAI